MAIADTLKRAGTAVVSALTGKTAETRDAERAVSQKQKMDQQELERLNKQLSVMRDAAMEPTKAWEAISQDGLNYLLDNQLHGKIRKEGWEPIQANHLYPAVAQEIALLCQRNITVMVEPQDPTDEKAAQQWGPLLQFWYHQDAKIPDKLPSWLLDGRITGHWIVKAVWNPRHEWDEKNEHWRGCVEAKLIRASFVGVDPNAETWDEAGNNVLRYRMPVARAILQWPEFEDEIIKAAEEEEEQAGYPQDDELNISSDIRPSMDTSDARQGIGRLAGLVSGKKKPVVYAPKWRGGDRDKGTPLWVTVEEHWFKDATEETRTQQTPIAQQTLIDQGQVAMDGLVPRFSNTGEALDQNNWPLDTKQSKVPLFPFGRFVVRVGDKTILNPRREDQRWKYRYWSLVLGVNLPLPHTWRGMNAVELAKGMQDWINVIWSHLLNYIKFFADPNIMVERGALYGDSGKGKLSSKLSAKAGAIWELNPGGLNRIQRTQPPNLPPAVQEILHKAEELLRRITGMEKTGMGSELSRRTTATEAAALAAMSQMRTALESIALDQFIVRLVYVAADIMQRELEPEETIRIIGDVGNDRGRMQRSTFTSEMQATPFEIKISTTSMIPFDRQREQEKWLTLAKVLTSPGAGLILEQLLDAFDVKEKKVILDKYAEWQLSQQVAASAKAAEGTQQGPPGSEEEQTWTPGQKVTKAEQPTSPFPA